MWHCTRTMTPLIAPDEKWITTKTTAVIHKTNKNTISFTLTAGVKDETGEDHTRSKNGNYCFEWYYRTVISQEKWFFDSGCSRRQWKNTQIIGLIIISRFFVYLQLLIVIIIKTYLKLKICIVKKNPISNKKKMVVNKYKKFNNTED